MKKVCIESVGRKVSLVKAFQEAGWDVYGQDLNPNAPALKFCKQIVGGVYLSDYLWIPTRDAEIADAWSINGWDSHPIEICVDKLRFHEWCKENGFKSPEVYFVKPRISKSGKEVECVWQEKLVGEEYSVDVFLDFNSKPISAVPRKRVLVSNGEASVTTTVSHQLLLEESLSLAQSLRLVGHNVLQAFVDGQKITWTDVNCRFGGASIVAIKAGCKSPEWLLKLVNGEMVKPVIGDYKVGLTGYSYTEWLFT